MQIDPKRDNKIYCFFKDIHQSGAEQVKISSGWSKGLNILTPEGLETRPTRERVRQAAINMLQPWILEARVLDLFAGSGAVGIELVSRGASGAHFVEKAPAALACLKKNTAEAALRADKQDIQLRPWLVEAADVLSRLKSFQAGSFDLVWADPPYEMVPEFLDSAAVFLPGVIAPGGVFVLESGAESLEVVNPWSASAGLELVKQRNYGATLITIWQKK